MKAIFTAAIVFISVSLFAQGELLRRGQSGQSFTYSVYRVDVDSPYGHEKREMVHNFSVSMTSRRKFEGGFSMAKLRDNLAFAPYIGAYLNSKEALHFKVAVAYNVVERESNFPSFSGVVFVNASEKAWIVPSVGLTASKHEVTFAGGLDFRFGQESKLVGGIFALKSKNIDFTVGLSLGFLFTEPNRVKPKEQ